METEHQRHQKAREAILRGEEAPKRIMVQMTSTKEDKERSEEAKLERERKSDRADALKEARTPWFCPKCNKVMKHRNDDKMYRMNGQCFDCQLDFEHQLRLEGKFEEYENKRILNNQLAYLNDQIESIEVWRKDASKQVVAYDQVGVKDIELHKEKWSQNTERVETMATESLEELNKMKEEVEEKLNSLEV
jgi:hypothetical protein